MLELSQINLSVKEDSSLILISIRTICYFLEIVTCSIIIVLFDENACSVSAHQYPTYWVILPIGFVPSSCVQLGFVTFCWNGSAIFTKTDKFVQRARITFWHQRDISQNFTSLQWMLKNMHASCLIKHYVAQSLVREGWYQKMMKRVSKHTLSRLMSFMWKFWLMSFKLNFLHNSFTETNIIYNL